MISKLSVREVFRIMGEDDLAYLMEYDPQTLNSLCNALSIELQEEIENENSSNRGKLH